jgi:hypothetical protein
VSSGIKPTQVCRGPGIDGFYHFDEGLLMLQEWRLLEVFGVEVLEESAG